MSDQSTDAQAAEPTTDVEAEAEAAWVSRGGVLGAVRILIGCCGLAGFVVGIVIAWHSASSTTILIVSAILFVLAALGLDWDELRGTYGGATLQLLRGGLKNVDEQIERVAAEAGVPPAVREELVALQTQVKALTPPEKPSRPARRTAGSDSLGINAMFRELARTKAWHSFPSGPHAVQLSLQIMAPQHDSRYRCTVKTPSGGAYTELTESRPRFIAITPSPNVYEIVYPDDFRGSEPLIPGQYLVEWRHAPLGDPAPPHILAALGQLASPPVATWSFTIPASGAVPAETTGRERLG